MKEKRVQDFEKHPMVSHSYCQAQDMFMESTRIQNVVQMRNFVKMMLGAPTICVEISNDQLNYIIRNCVQWIQKYHLNYGNYRDYLSLELIPGVTHYKICQELEGVVDFKTTSYLGGLNDLFTVAHNMLSSDAMGSVFGYTGLCYSNTAMGDVMGNYHAMLGAMKQLDDDFGEHYMVSYNEKDKMLMVQPTPQRPLWGLLQVYKRQRSEKIFNDVLFRMLCVAQAGMVWTNLLRKYNVTISGGGTLNADSLYSSYKEMWDWAVERIDKESPNGHCILVG